MTRREFLSTTGTAIALGSSFVRGAEVSGSPELTERIRGLMYGTALGDALGGPIEFQPKDAVQRLPTPPKLWRDDEVLDAAARKETATRLRLRSYHDLRAKPESYGQWNHDSVPGTITDDTRHKLILLHALRVAEQEKRWPIDARAFAQAYLDWPKSPAVTAKEGYAALAADWLEEYQLAARWVLGERDLTRARPTERLWGGLATCAGQMALLPLAAVFAGQPERAYRATYELAFIDNAWGKDMIAALVAGLAMALVTPLTSVPAAWRAVIDAIRGTDPYGFGKIRWTHRAVDRWLDLALKFAREAAGRPARFFATLEEEFLYTTKWEAQVPFVVVFGCAALAEYEPLVALQLCIEWGHDTDSFAQLFGAFAGALHGPTLFPSDWREAVAARLKADHQIDLDEECRRLTRLHQLAQTQRLVAER